MENHPSHRLPIVNTPETDIAYIVDNDGDAQALDRQMGGLVEIRQRVVQEVPLLRRKTSRTFQSPKRLDALPSSISKQIRL